MFKFVVDMSFNEYMRYIVKNTYDYKKPKVSFNFNDDGKVLFYSDFEKNKFFVYCNENRLIYFSPMKGFLETLTEKDGKVNVAGRFVYTKNIFRALIGNTVFFLCGIMYSATINFSWQSLLNCGLVWLLFVAVLWGGAEMISFLLYRNVYKKVIGFLEVKKGGI